MGNEDNRYVVFLEPSDQIVQPRTLERAERSGRLVHDDDVVLGMNGTHDFQHLLVGDRKRVSNRVRRDFHAHPFGEFAKALLHAAPVDDEPPVGDLAEEDVGQRRHFRDDRQFLIDGGNAVAALSARIFERDRQTLNLDVTAVGRACARQHANEGRLAGAVGANETVHFARLKHKADLAQRLNAGEGLPDVAHANRERRTC